MLKIEVIRFEAEDVITASVEQECICEGSNDARMHALWGHHGTCPATEHPNCVAVN